MTIKTIYKKPDFKYLESLPEKNTPHWILIKTEQPNSYGAYYDEFAIYGSQPSEWSETIQQTYKSQHIYGKFESLHKAISELKKLYKESIKKPNSYVYRQKKATTHE
jgi:hypothetical protein